jgi:uncharacterized protein (UPF0332 family)
MTLREDEREAMSRLYMDKAYEALQEARDTREQHPNIAVTRAYYSMFYAAQSSLVAGGVAGLRRHEGVNSNFGKLFVKTGKFPKEVSRAMGEAENDRYKADYDPGIKFTSLDAEKHIENAEKFVNTVKEMMEREWGKASVREGQTQTKVYAQNLAKKHVGERGQIFFACQDGVYEGVIAELTPAYVIQKVNEATAVIHRLKDLKNEKVEEQALIKVGESISIVKYGMNVTITPWDKEHENDQEKPWSSQDGKR